MAACMLAYFMRASIRCKSGQIDFFGKELFNRSFIHTNVHLNAGGKWREQRGMSRTGTSYGPLTDLPDWTYSDGRPPPATLSKRQLKRKKRQDAIGRRIKYLLKEVDLAKMQTQRIQDSSENNKNNELT